MSRRIVPVFLFVVALSAQAQNPGTVDGAVVNSVTGQPVKRAVVVLRPLASSDFCNAITDSAGRFHCDGVAPGRYLASATADGYAANLHTARTQKIFTVAAEQPVTGIALEMVPTGAIAGRVTDDAGQPLQGVMVMTLSAGATMVLPRGMTTTDDRGRYRIVGVPPGSYYIHVGAKPNQQPPRLPVADAGHTVHRLISEKSYHAMFYPNATEVSQAAAQDLAPGAEIAVDFHLPVLPVYHIRGRVKWADPPNTNMMLSAEPCSNHPTAPASDEADSMSAQELSAVLFGARNNVQPNGGFDISGVTSGEYCLWVRGGGRDAPGPPVTVKDDSVDGVEFIPLPAFAIHCTVELEGQPFPDPPPLSMGLTPFGGGSTPQVTVLAGALDATAIASRSYRVRLQPQADVYVKSIWYGSQEIANGIILAAQEGTPLRITLGTDPGELAVALSYAGEESGLPVTVAAYPEGAIRRPDLERSETRVTGSGPRWNWVGMAPGRYKIVAFETRDNDYLQRDKIAKLLEANAVTVEIHPREHASVNVTVVPADEAQKEKERLP